jgi:CRISPR-associated protein Csd2
VAADDSRDDDVALKPGANADAEQDIAPYVSPDVLSKYDVFSYRHAASLLANSFATEFAEIQEALRNFRLTCREMQMPGGNESDIPKKFSGLLREKSWVETRVRGDLIVHLEKQGVAMGEPHVIKDYIDGHKIDYVKGRVAFDLEWNSKDQTFDRDLYALRTFHECGLISVGVLVTRSVDLNPLFDVLPKLDKSGEIKLENGKEEMCRTKFGASTTWMGKLLYRLNAGRHGGCPILVFGIRPDVVIDWKTHERNPGRDR